MTSTDWKSARCVFSRMECFAPPSRNSSSSQFVRVTRPLASLGKSMPTKVMKTVLKKPSACRVPAFSHFPPVEKDDVLRRRATGDSPAEFASVLVRDLSFVVRRFQRLASPKRAQPKSVGRPATLTAKQVDLVVRTAENMIQAAGRMYQMTATMIRSALRSGKCETRTKLVRNLYETCHKNKRNCETHHFQERKSHP